MVPGLAILAAVLLLVGIAVVYDAVHVVEEGRIEAVLVFGEMQAVIEPGLNVLPPFVSRTCPIDPETMTIDTDYCRSVPDRPHAVVRSYR
jgi:regulator of protease activity HflC (stomatin/prohibitin superfamily)